MNTADLMSFNSPLRHQDDLKTNLSPGNNPYDSVLKSIENDPQQSEFVDISHIHPDDYFLKCDVGDLLEKESLGILKLEQLESSFNNDLLNTGKATLCNRFKTKTVLEIPSPIKELPSIDTFHLNSFNSKIRTSLTYEDPLRVELLNNSLNERNTVNVNSDNFDNSVLHEANHLASKLADGSILINGDYIKETTLDCTTPPDFVESEEEEPQEIITTDIVFNEIDNIVPVVEQNLPAPQKEEFQENLDSIFSKARRQSTCGNTDPKELLTNLYSIINNEKQDPKQNQKGQQLLLSLANVLCSENNCDNLEDSGHSSIEDDQQNDSYEILDLRVNKCTDTLKTDNKCFEASQTTPFNNIPNHTKSILNTKIKPRKLEDKGKKGPLKAVIPVMDMSKGVTPLRFQCTPLLKTPINEQLRPVAQSTPGISVQLPFFSTNSKKLLNPGTGNNSETKRHSRLSQATSTPNLLNKPEASLPKFFYRRHSSTELKRTDVKATLTHNSAGPSKLKQRVSSISSTPTRKSMLVGTQLYPRNVLNEKNRGAVKTMKSLNLLGKNQKNGKENTKTN